jgi:hypothetical protein
VLRIDIFQTLSSSPPLLNVGGGPQEEGGGWMWWSHSQSFLPVHSLRGSLTQFLMTPALSKNKSGDTEINTENLLNET